jgi:hypothetical protein
VTGNAQLALVPPDMLWQQPSGLYGLYTRFKYSYRILSAHID